jgi:succinate-semialdehyde dehydrogenase/glutarate-semialdehyde dehydrogenase
MAYGGYKKSGIGREGISVTLEEMSQIKNYVLKNIF